MYCIPMIPTGQNFQFFIFYASHQTRRNFCGKFIFHVELQRINLMKCSGILVVKSTRERQQAVIGSNLVRLCILQASITSHGCKSWEFLPNQLLYSLHMVFWFQNPVCFLSVHGFQACCREGSFQSS